jgi:hypothetical protein
LLESLQVFVFLINNTDFDFYPNMEDDDDDGSDGDVDDDDVASLSFGSMRGWVEYQTIPEQKKPLSSKPKISISPLLSLSHSLFCLLIYYSRWL